MTARAGGGTVASSLFLGRELLLETEDEGPDVAREKPGYDGLGAHLARQHVGSFKDVGDRGKGGQEPLLDGSFQDGLEELVVQVLHDLLVVLFVLRGNAHPHDSDGPGAIVLLLAVQLGLELEVLLGAAGQVGLELGVLGLGDLEEFLDGGETR